MQYANPSTEARPQYVRNDRLCRRLIYGDARKAARCLHRSGPLRLQRHKEQAMRLLPFGGRNAELETKNRILTDAARKRAERIEELERQVAQLERQVAHLKQEREPARKAIERAS